MLLGHLQHQITRLVGGGLQLYPVTLHLGKCDCRDTKQVTFHGRPDRARINGVIAHIGAVVDTGHHQVGTIAQQTGQSHMHAIGRGAVNVAKAFAAPGHIKR